MNAKEVAALLRIHVATVYKLVARGELPGFRIGTDWRFTSEQLAMEIDQRSAVADYERLARRRLRDD